MRISGQQIGGLVGAGIGTAIAPGLGTAIGGSLGSGVGGIADTFEAQNAAKVQRTSAMFGGPRIRPQPEITPSSPIPAGPQYLGAGGTTL